MKKFGSTLCAAAALAAGTAAFADLQPAAVFTGTVGVSVSGVGSNNVPVGNLTAQIPNGSTILKAYLYAAGTPNPYYAQSPVTAADYNGSGITIAGTPVTNFDTIVGATSTRADIGKFYTGRADVTALVSSLVGAGPNYSWAYDEGNLNDFIDGGVLAIIYSNAALPNGSVAFLDGGQNTAGETTTVNFSPIGDPNAVGFVAQMGIADSFSTGGSQASVIKVNGTQITAAAGGYDDGQNTDGGLITVGGLGDSSANPASPNDSFTGDDELYTLVPFLTQGDTSFTLFTQNESSDDNIFFMYLNITADISQINDTPTVGDTPEPASLGVLALGGASLLARRRRRA